MREILFRGKTIPECIGWNDEKEEEIYSESKWIYGGFGKSVHSCCIMTEEFMRHIHKGGMREMDGEINRVWVDPESVGQYTWQNDKNGNKIFEGDILKFVVNEGWGRITTRICEMRFENDTFSLFEKNERVIGFVDKNDCLSGLRQYEKIDYKTSEIIGNIYDNPELLEGK